MNRLITGINPEAPLRSIRRLSLLHDWQIEWPITKPCFRMIRSIEACVRIIRRELRIQRHNKSGPNPVTLESQIIFLFPFTTPFFFVQAEKSTDMSSWKQLDVAVVGGGIGGLATATSLRRAGHKVTIYERAHFAGEVGASISCAANGTKFLEHWGVNIPEGKPVILQDLIWHDWKGGEVTNVYSLKDYEARWGHVYNMFHRVDMHNMLMKSATGEEGEGEPAKLVVDHQCTDVDLESGSITFANGVKAQHDLVIGADGIGSAVRRIIGISPDKKQATSTCYHCIIPTEKVRRLGLHDFSVNNAIEYWGGHGIRKIVFSPCSNGEVFSFYCFFPTAESDHGGEGWNHVATVDQLVAPFADLDPRLVAIFKESSDIKPWRLFNHQPYSHWQKGRACILGDAAHPMMPDQSQGACSAIEDAGALGIIFGKNADYDFTNDVRAGLSMYETIRKPRATKVQAASARARLNMNERIGFSSNTNNPNYKVADEKQKLTVEEMNEYDMWRHVADEAKKTSSTTIDQPGVSEEIVVQANL